MPLHTVTHSSRGLCHTVFRTVDAYVFFCFFSVLVCFLFYLIYRLQHFVEMVFFFLISLCCAKWISLFERRFFRCWSHDTRTCIFVISFDSCCILCLFFFFGQSTKWLSLTIAIHLHTCNPTASVPSHGKPDKSKPRRQMYVIQWDQQKKYIYIYPTNKQTACMNRKEFKIFIVALTI